jgi:hypothetical protein
MRQWRPCCALVVIFLAASAVAVPQETPVPFPTPTQKEEVRLPNGKLQKDEILKAEHEQTLRDAAQLAELAQQLQQDLEKEDRYVISLTTLKKTEDIEKLAKKIRTRLRHN